MDGRGVPTPLHRRVTAEFSETFHVDWDEIAKGPYEEEARRVSDTLEEEGPSPAELDAVTHTFTKNLSSFLLIAKLIWLKFNLSSI